ncbi:hypothetical protein Q9189_005461 [Teloschistes chrysophthalmus]
MNVKNELCVEQIKPELDALQQRHELEAVPKEPCEMEGHDSRPEMMTQADEVQELGLPEPSHELDGKEIQSSKVRGPSRR